MSLEIPKQDSGSIATIKALSKADLGRFIGSLAAAPPVSSPREMAEFVAKDLPSVPMSKLIPIIETLYRLYHIRELSGVPTARFLNDLIEGIQENPNLPLPKKEQAEVQAMLERLLSIETLKTVSKAARLQRDGERLYCEAKVLSDIRPVFGPDPSVVPIGAVLTHTLRIGYHEGSAHKEFHVILDADDLKALAEVILRAKAKDASLRNVLKAANLTDLGE
jgi:hypothetical protein